MIRLIVTGLAILVAVLVAACGGSDAESTSTPPAPSPTAEPTASPTATPTPVAVSASDVIVKAVAAMQQVTSLHFEMESQVTANVQGTSLTIPLKFSADYLAPDQMVGTISATLAFVTFESKVVVTGDAVYVTAPLSGEWIVAEANPLLSLPIYFVTADLVELLQDATAVEEDLDGIRTYRIDASIPLENLGDATARFDAQFWIGAEDSRLRQVSASGDFDLGEDVTLLQGMTLSQGSVSVTARFSDYGKEVSITVPVLTSASSATPTTEAEGTPAPTAPPAAQAPEPLEAEALRQLALDYWAAFNSYDVDKVLSYLEESYRAEQESSIRSNIGQMQSFGVKLGISEQSPPQLIGEGRWEMTIRVQDPLSTRTLRVEFVQVGGEWKISAAEEVR